MRFEALNANIFSLIHFKTGLGILAILFLGHIIDFMNLQLKIAD
jgi:hypothetical protein